MSGQTLPSPVPRSASIDPPPGATAAANFQRPQMPNGVGASSSAAGAGGAAPPPPPSAAGGGGGPAAAPAGRGSQQLSRQDLDAIVSRDDPALLFFWPD